MGYTVDTIENENNPDNPPSFSESTKQPNKEVDCMATDLGDLQFGPIRPKLQISGSTGSGSSKRSKSKLELHAACKQHLISKEKWNSYILSKKNGSVHAVLSTAHSEHIEKNRNWKIQNELIDCCSNTVFLNIIRDIRHCEYFALMCDEARFVGFVDVSISQNTEALSSAILSFLDKHNILNVPIIAQSYDGANVMSGNHNGVQKKIKGKNPFSIYIHCMAHRTNLVVIDMCKSIKDARNIFNGLEALYIHFSIPLKNMMLVDIQEKLGIKKTKPCSNSDTKWSCRFKNCKMVMEHYSSIIKVLKYEIDKNTDKNVANTIGILYTMEKTSFLVHLFVLHEILLIINILSNKLQEKTATLGKASQVIDSVIATLETNRRSKRKRTQPNKLSNYITGESEEHSSNDIMTCYRVKYFIILDTVIMNLEIKFSKESMKLANSVDGFLMFDYLKSITFINHYKNLLNTDVESLKAEMMVAQNLKKQSTDNKMMTPEGNG
ncbi:zinc finger MYM-type protein 1-like [Acyrthosiphon pisum]|uniref:Zinc finger MYM-type protein 1-like n=1 Tax=Acyrthosiphon pisum TaxID=7029 RepID=A0A8R2JKN7_ACYPI|nr:zinc finger MYM-type protein 1-like [Acyrthosiphon pisum]